MLAMEESSQDSNGKLYIPDTSSTRGCFANGMVDAHIRKQTEEESNSLASHSNHPTKEFESDSLFGVDPPPYQSTHGETASAMASRSHGAATASWHDFTYDVLLIYDPDSDYYAAQELLTMIEPQNLNIFDFARDRPPGATQAESFAAALRVCKYTCIVVTRNFIQNYWLKLKADMAVQDMIENEHKQYTLIVIVMDLGLPEQRLPLDLRTLSPIFQKERYFKTRVSNAFKGMPLQIERSMRSQWSMPMQDQPRSSAMHRYSHHKFERNTLSHETNQSELDYQFPKDHREFADSPYDTNYSTKESLKSGPESFGSLLERKDFLSCSTQQSTISGSEASSSLSRHQPTSGLSAGSGTIPQSLQQSSSDPAICNMRTRIPKEHTEVSCSETTEGCSKMLRTTSVTRGPMGARKPKESDESIMTLAPSRPAQTARDTPSQPPVTSFPQTGADESNEPNMSTLREATVSTLLSEDALPSRATPPLPVDVEHFSFEGEAPNTARPPPAGSVAPAPGDPTGVVGEAQDSQGEDDDSLGQVNLEISTDELPAAFRRIDPEPQGAAAREDPDEGERNDSLLVSLKRFTKRWKSLLK